MEMLKIILFFMATIWISLSLKFVLLPNIKRKWRFFVMKKILKQMASKYKDEKTKEQLEVISKGLNDLKDGK